MVHEIFTFLAICDPSRSASLRGKFQVSSLAVMVLEIIKPSGEIKLLMRRAGPPLSALLEAVVGSWPSIPDLRSWYLFLLIARSEMWPLVRDKNVTSSAG